MKVNPNAVQQAEASRLSRTQEAQKAKDDEKSARDSSRAERASGDVNASISEKAREMSVSQKIAMNAPEVREDLIADLKARIAAKEYDVSSDAIADRMVTSHLESQGLD